jgi:glucose-1-phosphate cytidylyltransferase
VTIAIKPTVFSKTASLDAMILCGGLGTRLREETEFKPKPMVEIGTRPILWHILKHYAAFGVDRSILCLGYKGDVIRDYFLNYHHRSYDIEVDVRSGSVEFIQSQHADRLEARVVLAETGAESQTGRRILRALPYVQGERFFATYGDAVANVDINALLETHLEKGRLATVSAVHPSSRFGELRIEDGIIHRFAEKPQIADGWINGGYFVFEKRAFELLDATQNLPLETGLLEKLAEMGELAVYHHEGFWQCMDTFREMQLLNDLWQSGRAPWRMW